jgi:hypothetical protein
MGDAGATAMEAAGSHATTMEAPAATTAGKRIIGNQARSDKNKRCHCGENISKHGVPPPVGVPCIGFTMPDRHPTPRLCF